MSWTSRRADQRLARVMRGRRALGPSPSGAAAAPGGPGADGILFHLTLSVPTLFVIVMFVLLAGATASYAIYSGALRWLLYALVLGVVGFLAIRVVAATVADPAGLGARIPAPANHPGDLAYLRTTLQRAQRGLGYSQLVFEARLREAFLEKVRVLRDIPEDSLVAAVRDPARLQAILRDKKLTRFVLESDRNSRGYPATATALPKRTDFAGRTRRLLDRMEAWQ